MAKKLPKAPSGANKLIKVSPAHISRPTAWMASPNGKAPTIVSRIGPFMEEYMPCKVIVPVAKKKSMRMIKLQVKVKLANRWFILLATKIPIAKPAPRTAPTLRHASRLRPMAGGVDFGIALTMPKSLAQLWLPISTGSASKRRMSPSLRTTPSSEAAPAISTYDTARVGASSTFSIACCRHLPVPVNELSPLLEARTSAADNRPRTASTPARFSSSNREVSHGTPMRVDDAISSTSKTCRLWRPAPSRVDSPSVASWSPP
mmetsp:Transcript_60019/g.195920  ORF Transcript_60019/g.195920 Transcript_60019/m.195920 type:complete len:261 (-) Transcript_60019:146-928(-)